jgi:acetyl-CoA C-acetyltransferase
VSSPAAVPVIVGVAQLLQRQDDPRAAAEPLAMMMDAARRAGDDAGAPALLARADAIWVPRGMWRYGDAGRAVAERLGAQVRESVGTPYGGNFAQACVIDAARQIQAGRSRVALVVGAESGRTIAQAERQRIALAWSEIAGEPDRKVAEDKAIFHDAELARGMNSASDVFAIIDSAIRAERRETLEAHAARLGELWAGFSAVASGNPSAWIRKPISAQAIREASAENPMISSPYTRLMNANSRVDMAAALLLCSLETARAAGVPDEQLVYLHAAAEANDSNFLSERMELHRSPAIELAGARVLEMAGSSAERIEHVDLYSCFPAAVQVTARELGMPAGRALTVTGGLTFGGGPMNSYGLHAVARMVEVVREDRGAKGLVHGNGGWLAKHSLGVYSAAPPEHGFRYENLQARLDALPLREALIDWSGPVTLEGYTVAHAKGAPRVAHVACLTDDGRRTWASTADADVMAAMLREEFCGRRGRVDGRGGLAVG